MHSVELWRRLTDLYVLGSIVSQPLVHLVAEAQHIVFDAQISDHLELFGLVNLSRTKCALMYKNIIPLKTVSYVSRNQLGC